MNQRMLFYFVLWECSKEWGTTIDRILPGSPVASKKARSMANWILWRHFSVPRSALDDFFHTPSRKNPRRSYAAKSEDPKLASKIANVVSVVQFWASLLRR